MIQIKLHNLHIFKKHPIIWFSYKICLHETTYLFIRAVTIPYF